MLQATLPNGRFAIPSASGINCTATCPTFLSALSTFREEQFDINVDHNLTSKDHHNRANLVTGQKPGYNGSAEARLNNYCNTAAFAGSCTNTPPYGTSSRNLLRGPGQRNVDFSAIKRFPVTEKTNLEFRSELFNIFNFANFRNPNNNVLVPSTLGVINSSSAGPRVIQFALKVNY